MKKHESEEMNSCESQKDAPVAVFSVVHGFKPCRPVKG